MRIFIGLTEIAGYYTNLKQGFDELGVKCTFIDMSDNPFKYGDKQPNLCVRLIKYATKKRTSTPRYNLLLKVWWICFEKIARVVFFIWALMAHDVFIFGFKSSFFEFRDLPILKMLNKKIIYMFHGADCRPPYISGAFMAASKGITIEECIQLTRKQKQSLRQIERYADIIINAPSQSHLLERRFVLGPLVGLPYSFSKSGASNPKLPETHKVRILHSPSRPEVKGTPKIREAIERLKRKDYPLEYVEIIGKPNAEVLNELARCDFIVDQVYSDTPMAGFATEAAFFGKPAVVGGYAHKEMPQILPPDKIPPSHYCHPDEIEKALEKLIVNENYRIELGKRAKQFVEANWTPEKVAERYLRLIEGRIPEEWMYHPKDIHYLHGSAISEHRVKQVVRTVIEKGGKEALQLSDKPELERRFIEFAYSETDTLSNSPKIRIDEE